MTHPTRAFSGSIINRLTGSKILARVGQISVAFPPINWKIKYRFSSRIFWFMQKMHYLCRWNFLKNFQHAYE